MQSPVERVVERCRWRWRERVFAGALVVAAACAVTAGFYFGRLHFSPSQVSSPRIDRDRSTIRLASDAAPEEGFYLVEDALTGATLKRRRAARSPEFRRWTRYKVVDRYETSRRLV